MAQRVYPPRSNKGKRDDAAGDGRDELYGVLVGQLPANVLILSREAAILYANECALQYAGVSLSDIRSPGHVSALHPDDVESLRERLSRVGESAQPVPVEFRVRRADGDYRWQRGTARPLSDKDGPSSSSIVAATDVHEEKLAHDALAKSEALYRALVEAMPELVGVVDVAGRTHYRNRAFYDYTGVTEEQALDWWNQGLVLQEDVFAVAAEWQARTSRGLPTAAELRVRRRDGEYRWHLVQAAPLNSLAHWLLIATDVHDRKLAEQALLDALAARDQAVALHRSTEEQLTLLVEASSGMIESLELQEMLPKILRISMRLIAADAYALSSVDDQNTEWRILASEGLSPDYLANASLAPVTATTPTALEVMAIEDVHAAPLLADRVPGYDLESIVSLLVLPLVVGGVSAGTLTFYYRQRHEFSDGERRVATALANLTASALRLAHLNDEERLHRERVEEANRRLALFAEASSILASSLEYESALQLVAGLTVPAIADGCILDVADASGELRTLAVAAHDPDGTELLATLGASPASRLTPALDPRQALAERRPRLWLSRRPDALESEDAHAGVAEEFDLRSTLVAPLIARGAVVGAITLATGAGHVPLSLQDVPFVEELARRIAVAIDNARLYREAESIADDLREANSVKDEFLGMVSHELKTPITMILGGSDILTKFADQIDALDRRAALRDINESARRLGQLVDNLLFLSRLEIGKMMDLEPVLVRYEVERVVAEYRLREPGRTFTVTLEPSNTPVAADPTNLRQVLENLIGNAIKYSPSGAPVDVTTQRREHELIVSVLDRGTGITAAEAELVFEPFYRSERTSQMASGAGIGLTVCRRLIEAQGGRIWATPRDGGGSVFSIALAVDLAVDASDPDWEHERGSRDRLPVIVEPSRYGDPGRGDAPVDELPS